MKVLVAETRKSLEPLRFEAELPKSHDFGYETFTTHSLRPGPIRIAKVLR